MKEKGEKGRGENQKGKNAEKEEEIKRREDTSHRIEKDIIGRTDIKKNKEERRYNVVIKGVDPEI